MNDLTFLTYDQVFGEHRLDIINRYGTKCAMTDFSILLGCNVSRSEYTSEGIEQKNRAGCWWIKSGYGNNYACVIGRNFCIEHIYDRQVGARPAVAYSSIQSIATSEKENANGIIEIAYGEYPQTIVDENYSSELEKAYSNGNLKITGKHYTTDSHRYQMFFMGFKVKTHTEYEYNGSRYIRFVSNSNCYGRVLSDDRIVVQPGNIYWVRVEPIIWLVDKKADIALSKKIIFSGVQFKRFGNYKGNFDESVIKKFIDNCFAKEIVTDIVYSCNTFLEQSQNDEKQKKMVMEKNTPKLESTLLSKNEEEKNKVKLIVSQIIELQKQLNKLEHIDVKDKTIIMSDILFESKFGYKEIRKTFKIHSLLKYLNLQFVSFDNVKVRGIDLSYTSADIDPQKVYNKDMSKGNYSGLNFINMDFNGVDMRGANFTDCCFDFASLEGAIMDETTILPLQKSLLLKNINVKVKKL